MAATLSASDHPSLEEMLAVAAEKTGKYEWMDGAALYQKARGSAQAKSNDLEAARLTELLARCYFKGAFQSRTREEFKRKMQLAEAAYESAFALYEGRGSEALAKRTEARGLFANFWFKEDPAERREIIRRCIALADEAREDLKRRNDASDLAETHKDLLDYFQEEYFLVQERTSLKELFERANRICDDAIDEFERLGDDEGLLESLYVAVFFLAYVGMGVLEPPIKEDLVRKLQTLIGRLSEVSKKIGKPHASCLANQAAGRVAGRVEGEDPKALRLFEAAVQTAQATNDSYLIGTVLADTVDHSYWAVFREEYVEAQREILERALGYASTAIKNLEIPSHSAWLGNAYGYYAECYTQLAVAVETEAKKKRAYLWKAIEISRKGTVYEDHLWWWYTGNALGNAMYSLATIDEDPRERENLLRESLPIRERTVQFYEVLFPHSWRLGIMRSYLALVKAELSNMEREPEKKSQLLKESVSDMEGALEQCSKWLNRPDLMIALAGIYDSYGDILLSQHRLTGDADIARKEIKAYEDAITYLTRAGLDGPIAALRWKIAKVYDTIADHKQASHFFRKAAEDYRLGARKIPSSASVFAELASYMDAWSLIEEARLHHSEEQYLLAAEKYTMTASMLQPTKGWRHLSKHYTACSFLEGGEALSRQERQEASIESFSEAVKTFREAKSDMHTRLGENFEPRESEELTTWHRVTDGRERYCQGRIELEEAKTLDRRGDEEASSTKYLSAAEIFKALLAEAETEQARKELETLVLLCEAWGKMKKAEAIASPELYSEAANAFARIEKLATRSRFTLMALANASICKALESGTMFRRTRNTQLYSEIKKQLETATDYYQQAGLQNAAEWTRATGNLFDALVYLADAATERESKKKTEFYYLAEKHLQLAAKLYAQAGFPTRKEEALKHLERARQAKETLLTPMEALLENPAVQGAALTPVSLLRDSPLGLERFEDASIVGNLSTTLREVGVGSDITLELEIVNVGKTPATLIKLENIAPDGLELDRQKIQHRVVDNFIDMKGKRLEYLKTHEVKIPMKAMQKGGYQLRPRILFVDERGSYRSYDFEPVSITVRELGLSGWLKGP